MLTARKWSAQLPALLCMNMALQAVCCAQSSHKPNPVEIIVCSAGGASSLFDLVGGTCFIVGCIASLTVLALVCRVRVSFSCCTTSQAASGRAC